MKPWYTSKTIWINALTLCGLILPIVSDPKLYSDNPQLVIWLGVINSVVNVALRFLTTQSISTPKRRKKKNPNARPL